MNKGSNSLKQTNRSQSLSALANDSQPLKRSSISNSTISLSSPNKDINANGKNDKNHSRVSESDDEDEEYTKSTEETTEESDEEESKGSSQTKQSSENHSSDNAVQVRPITAMSKKKAEPGKRTAPVPQVRFSKLVNHMKK